jgi:hypothetical protein
MICGRLSFLSSSPVVRESALFNGLSCTISSRGPIRVPVVNRLDKMTRRQFDRKLGALVGAPNGTLVNGDKTLPLYF